MCKKGFTLVELMVVVAIVAILAAVALPMYSSFKQKGHVSVVIKGASGLAAPLQALYTNRASFTGLAVEPTGGAVTLGSQNIGGGLPRVPNMEWSITSPTSSIVRLNWNFTANCPTSVCNGYYQLACSLSDELCTVSVRLDDLNTLGMNF